MRNNFHSDINYKKRIIENQKECLIAIMDGKNNYFEATFEII